MKEQRIELLVGVFVAIGLAALAYLSINLGHLTVFGAKTYTVNAIFTSSSGLKDGDTIEIAGVEVGKVAGVRLKDYNSIVSMNMDSRVKLPDDTIASIRTRGIIGAKFVKLTPGGSEQMLKPGETIINTESSIDIEELVSKYIFSLSKPQGGKGEEGAK
jgi:phospholipid/cholesterol/gamma-HCH transport system substrate-binding protein